MENTIAIKEVKISKWRPIAYWAITSIVALQVAAAAYLDLSRYPDFCKIAVHLGYPLYLLTVLGVLRIFAFIVLLAPRLPRLKEWTYAGLFFEYIMAIVSHITVGDGMSIWIQPLIFVGLLLGSWYLRPASRTLLHQPT